MLRSKLLRSLIFGGIVLVALPLGLGCPDDPFDPWEDFPGVRIDLEPYLHADGTGAVARLASADDLVGGERPIGRDGDWYLANDRIRVMVRGPDRAMGPAPWGGSLMGGDLVRPDGEPDQSSFGELSLLLNFGRTLLPEDFRVIHDGTDGGGVVLAVTGRDTLNDFINVPILLENNLADAGRLALDPEEDLDLVITQFYILNPGETRVRVVTAMRNEGDAHKIVTTGELVHSGGNNTLFNPVRQNTHFGYGSLPLPEPADDYLAWVTDHVAYAYAPRMDGEPTIAMTVSGVTGTIVGAEDMFEFMGVPDLQPEDLLPLGAAVLPPQGTEVVVRDFYIGRDLASVNGAWLADGGAALGRIEGQVEMAGSVPSGTRIAAHNESGRLITVFNPRSNGQFTGRLPAGTYRLRADVPGHPFSEPVTVAVPEGGQTSAVLNVPAAAEVTVSVQLPDGSPSPAKVTFVCADTCPKLLRTVGRDFRDTVTRDPLPTNVMHVGFIGVEGEKRFTLPPGDYHVVVSRGAEYSVWPHGWPSDPGPVHTLAAGSPTRLEAEIAQVLDTAGWLSADLHVHGINSPDAFVPHLRRVLSFLAEGVDVLVSTDHDFVTDWAPYVTELEADALLTTVIGNEMTTFDWGHFNVFPLEVDPSSRTGSAVDWGNADGPTLTPAQLFDVIEATAPVGREKVVQVNHPRGVLGHFTAIGLDTGNFTTAADPADFRMDPPAPVGADTRLFDPRFTAMETFNGWDTGSFVTRTNDWFAFLQRGLQVTATAVSDTHREFSAAVGSPRSWIYMGAGSDTVPTFDLDTFVGAVNGQKLMGGNGPFIRLRAASNGNSAGLGEMLSLASSTDPVELQIEVQVPTWFGFDRIEVYANIEGTDARPFSEPTSAPDPTYVIDVDLSEEPTVAGVSAADADSPHRRWVVTRTLEVTPTEDTWYVVMVKGSVSGFPVILEQNVNALAFTNPVYVDVDGDGVFRAPEPIGLAPEGADQMQRPALFRPEGPRVDLDSWKKFMDALTHGH